jgi:plasmid stabilization system protein ParE
MAFKLIIKPVTWLDIEEAIDWYENESKGLGKRFFKSFEDALEKIVKNPDAYLFIIPDVRRVLLKNFPYKIFYSVSPDTIFIIGVFHAKRSKGFIRRRLKR